MTILRTVFVALVLCLAIPAAAVQPDEVLADPELEARAREISQVIRCPVCQGENIDESNASVARDLRLVIRERLMAGDGDDAVVAFVVDRYGEFVLFDPPASGSTVLLWIAGPLMLSLALLVAALAFRRRSSGAMSDRLTEDESARLSEILKE